MCVCVCVRVYDRETVNPRPEIGRGAFVRLRTVNTVLPPRCSILRITICIDRPRPWRCLNLIRILIELNKPDAIENHAGCICVYVLSILPRVPFTYLQFAIAVAVCYRVSAFAPSTANLRPFPTDVHSQIILGPMSVFLINWSIENSRIVRICSSRFQSVFFAFFKESDFSSPK